MVPRLKAEQSIFFIPPFLDKRAQDGRTIKRWFPDNLLKYLLKKDSPSVFIRPFLLHLRWFLSSGLVILYIVQLKLSRLFRNFFAMSWFIFDYFKQNVFKVPVNSWFLRLFWIQLAYLCWKIQNCAPVKLTKFFPRSFLKLVLTHRKCFSYWIPTMLVLF